MKSEDRSYLQCQNCGRIYISKRSLDIEDFYIYDQQCPSCGGKIGINVGNNKDIDFYKYYNPNLDERFFNY